MSASVDATRTHAVRTPACPGGDREFLSAFLEPQDLRVVAIERFAERGADFVEETVQIARRECGLPEIGNDPRLLFPRCKTARGGRLVGDVGEGGHDTADLFLGGPIGLDAAEKDAVLGA